MLLVVPAIALVFERLLSPLWADISRIRLRRWLLFLVPAAAIAGFAAWNFLSMPEVEHRLEIIPASDNVGGAIQLSELRAAYGNAVPLSTFAHLAGWRLEQGLLVSADANPAPILYSFVGSINEQVRLTFLALPQGGQVQVTLDGRSVDVNLAGPDGDERRARLDTAYRWGPLNFLIVPMILAADLFAILFLLAAVWLMQEITQNASADPAQPAPERFFSHAQGLALICILAIALHALHFLSVPLAVLKDSPSYLQGAIYWMQHHNLDGVSSYRGLGTTLLFTPAMAPFGRNPLGLKLLLHLLAICCVPLSYRLGWQLSRRRWLAFAAGLLTALIPDLYAYSSFVLSEAAHVFFGLLFCTLMISALQELSFGWILVALVAGSCATLVRSEDMALLLLGAGSILAKLLWLRSKSTSNAIGSAPPLWQFALAILAAAVPLFAWSAHNQRVYGFFGLSDYGGEILYDGWVYFGESSQIAIVDHNSSALRAIEAVHAVSKPAQGDAPTGWTIYNALLDRGYTSEQAFAMLQKATLDSIRKDPALSLRLLLVKLRQGFEPHPFIPATFLLPGERPAFDTLNADYFDQEHIFIPPLIHFQRWINGMVARSYAGALTGWFWLGALMLFICLYRRPFFQWATLSVITASSILLPTIVGMSMWRYVLFGVVMMQFPLLAGVQSAGRFMSHYVPLLRRNGLRPGWSRSS